MKQPISYLGSKLDKLLYSAVALATAFVFSLNLPNQVAQVTAAACTQSVSTVNDQSDVVTTTYNDWKKAHVVADGANLRVQRSVGDKRDTVSEGIAYGMIFAAYNNDRTAFDKLWAYEQAHLDDLGLMNWRIAANGTTTGANSATDADEDMAIALIAADKQWGGYEQAAKQQLDLLLAYTVEPGTNILKPGDKWGGSDVLNPSYISPAYYKAFATYSGNARWNNVNEANDNVLASIAQNSNSRTTGLVPNWSNSLGQPAYNMSYDYSYDSIRNPIRLALDSQWYCDSGSTKQLSTFNSFFARQNTDKIVDGYKLNGVSFGANHNSSFVGPVAAASVVSDDAAYQQAIWKKLSITNDREYYNDSIKLLSMMVATGKFINPLDFNAPPIDIPDVPSVAVLPEPDSNIDIWWPIDGSTVAGTFPLKAQVPGKQVQKYDMYWQVDGGFPNPMPSNYTGWPHKETYVNVSGWNWRGKGPYDLTFSVYDADGNIVSSKTSSITIRR